MAIAYPEFRPPRCTRFRYRYSECRRCAAACPHEAIELSDEGAKIDAARCRNCGLCLLACHTGGWTSESFKPIDLLRQAIKQPTFSVACAPSGLRADVVVPCLGALSAAFIAYLGKRRIPLAMHGSSHCGECAHGAKGAVQLAAHLDAANRLRDAAREAGKDWLEPELSDAQPRAGKAAEKSALGGRRQLFRRLIGRGVDAIASPQAVPSPPAPDKAIRAGAYAGTEERELLQIVCDRKDGQPTFIEWHEALPLMQLKLHQGCTNCEACFRACPTGALQIVENPGDWALTFQVDRCVACEVCLEVCQPHVLDAEARFDARPERPATILHSLVKQRCMRCDRFFVSSTPQETCPVCSDDEDAFAQIFG